MKKLTDFNQLQKAIDDIPKLVHQDMVKDLNKLIWPKVVILFISLGMSIYLAYTITFP